MRRKRSDGKKKSPGTLRKRAEALLRMTPANLKEMKPADVRRLIHEVQIHQIELELQNEELRETQVELAQSRNRYSDLYEFAPVGYITMDKNGKILQSNLTAATMLGIERRSLLRANISKFVTRESQDNWYRYRLGAFATETRHVCEIGMCKADGTPLTVHLESIAYGSQDDRRCNAALIDITTRIRAEEAVRLINIAKHAQTDLAHLSMRKTGGNLQVKIEDHGAGFDPATHSSRVEAGEFGLFSVRERLVYLGGTFQLQSAPREGTTVTLTLPLAAKAAKRQTT